MSGKQEISRLQNDDNKKNEPQDKLSTDIEAAEKKLQLIKIGKEIAKGERELATEKRSRMDDMLSWSLSKIIGVGALSIGAIEYLDPAILDVVLKEPLSVAGAGLGLLVGKEVISRFTKMLDVWGK